MILHDIIKLYIIIFIHLILLDSNSCTALPGLQAAYFKPFKPGPLRDMAKPSQVWLKDGLQHPKKRDKNDDSVGLRSNPSSLNWFYIHILSSFSNCFKFQNVYNARDQPTRSSREGASSSIHDLYLDRFLPSVLRI